jgi:hypothetical protein
MKGADLRYEAPSIVDYGDVHDITAERIFRVSPDAEHPGEVPSPVPPGTLDDTTGPCIPGSPQPPCP